MTWHNSGKTPEIEHDAQSSRRYKEDLDDLWLRIKALEIEVSSLRQVRDAVLDCEGVEMRNCYEVPKDEWEAAMSFAARWVEWYDGAETRRSEAISRGDHWDADLLLI